MDTRVEVARFDTALQAWILSRYADVLAALREPRLSAEGGRSEGPLGITDQTAHSQFRKEALATLSPAKLDAWRAQIGPLARSMLDRLPADRTVDLAREFAEPWSLAVAMLVTGAAGDPVRLAGLARHIFAAAAEPQDSALQSTACQATAELAQSFPGGLVPLQVQTFVALSQTLPCFLASAWLALFRHPAEMRLLQAEPDLMPGAIEELLRYAGPARAQFRRTLASVEVGCARIAPGDRVILMLAAANRDPAQFPEPDRLDLRRRDVRHLAFGAGAHACIGAPLIRMAAAAATAALLESCGTAEVYGPIEWRGGFAIRAPASLGAFLRRQTITTGGN